MLRDMVTILWKDARESYFQRPSIRGGWMGLVVLLGVFGILLPLQNGPEWVSSPANLIIWGWVPYLLVSGVVADAIAGERERHTLETLLASRLSDSAILFGKVAAAMIYGWGITLVSVLLSLVTINLVHSQGRLLLFPWPIAVGIVGISFLVSLLAAGLGVLISLRSSSVRQAQQTFSLIFLVIFIPILLLPILPVGIREQVQLFILHADLTGMAVWAAALLAVLDIALLLIARARFRRSLLILD